MNPRLDIQFPLKRQWQFLFGKEYEPHKREYLLNHARSGIILTLHATLPNGGRVGVVAYNCHTVANAIVNAGCTPIFLDVTEELKIDVDSIPVDLDGIVVTNLFGIQNDIEAIRKHCPQAIIIVDNAHGYGLSAEGDFTVYSINQGKFPALGEGGILVLNKQPSAICHKIDELYAMLPKYGLGAQIKLFFSMLIKAVAYSKLGYWLTIRIKKSANPNVHEKVVMKQMAPGIRKLYRAWLPYEKETLATHKRNAGQIIKLQSEVPNSQWLIGENAFMLIARTQDPTRLKAWFAKQGIETDTHFKYAIKWATEFGYVSGSCFRAERLTKELLMVPTYIKI